MEKRAMAVREEQWLQTIAAAKQSGLQKSDAERHLHGVLATPCRRASDTSPP